MNVHRRAALAVLAVLAAAASALTACTSGGGGNPTPAATGSPSSGLSAPAGSSTSAPVATRWWSNSAAADGSTIDPKAPDAAAERLHPSRSQYCTMLKQTLAAGKSILPGATAGDPALLNSTKAFVGELGQVAPAAVSGQWQVLGKALVAFVESRGTSLGPGITSARLTSASAAVAADAKSHCHVDIGVGPA